MSWGAHQFEIYAIQAHLPRRMRGRISFFGVWLGDFTPDFLAKFWVYGVTIGSTHYGAHVPHRWHRGWPGVGFTHTLSFGLLVAGGLWLWRRRRALTVGYALGFAAHALTDVNDSVGTMLLFPFSTLNWTTQAWSYAATVSGGKYLDAAAYYSSLGLVMDLLWLGVVLGWWRALTREFWRTEVVPADPHGWARLGGLMPERALLALYHATFFYGICRVVSWSTWTHVVARPVIDGVRRVGYPLDLSWTGPWWIGTRSLPHAPPALVPVVAGLLLVLVYATASALWERMGAAEAVARGAGA